MKPEKSHFISTLNFRSTPLRQALLGTLQASTTPLSLSEFLKILKRQSLRVNKTSVYRNLELFCRLGLVTKVSISDQKQYFELAHRKHHHHFICLGCGAIADIHLADDQLIRSVMNESKRLGFAIERHAFEFYGRCQACLIH